MGNLRRMESDKVFDHSTEWKRDWRVRRQRRNDLGWRGHATNATRIHTSPSLLQIRDPQTPALPIRRNIFILRTN